VESRSSPEDKRLERLYEYTKWHIGIYLSMGAGIVTLVGTGEKLELLRDAIGDPALVLAAFAFMIVAGIAGGTVVSTCTQCRNFEEVWYEKHAPLDMEWLALTGKSWAQLEHLSFWISLGFLAAAVIDVASRFQLDPR